MLAYGLDMDVVIKQLMQMINTITIKRNEEADAYETAEIKKASDQYIAMIESGTNWNSFATFDYYIMKEVGLSEAVIDSVNKGDKDAVPYEYREILCRKQKEYIINDYVEKNTYYRMLHGEPPIDATEKDFVYLSPDNSFGLSSKIPVHLMSDTDKEYIISTDLLDELMEKYPDKPYLKYLGTNAISYYKARSAKNFEILSIVKCESENLYSDFTRCYAACRNYVMIGLYNTSDQRMYEHYDSFMGMLVMIMSVQRLFCSIFKQGISRDFYDDNIIRSLFESYNIPYIESISSDYQKVIAKKLNLLLQKKSSNSVLFDISSIFNFRGINIYKYYLVKDYKKDSEGNPIIIYKEICDEYGNTQQVVDYEKTFDIFFQKVNIESSDPIVEINDASNRVPYDTLTMGDPYWIEDSDLITKLYETNFNHVLSKYMSIDVIYDLAKLTYQTAYCMRMIIDDQRDFKLLKISLPYVNEPVSLFDALLFVSALVAKKYHMAGNVPLDTYKIANVYGFNFKVDIEKLKEDIVTDMDNRTGYYKEVSSEVFDYLVRFSANSLEEARKLYDNIDKLRKWLVTMMRYTNNLSEYNAYKKLYNALLVTKDTTDLYTKADGSLAHTYLELLKDRRPDLAQVVEDTKILDKDDPDYANEDEVNKFSVNNKINKTLEKMSNISDQLADIKYANDKSEIVVNVEKVINQFKSYTVDQADSGITYVLNDPYFNFLKIIDTIGFSHRDRELKDELGFIYQDVIHLIEARILYKNELTTDEKYYETIISIISNITRVIDKLIMQYKEELHKTDEEIYDVLTANFISMLTKIKVNATDKLFDVNVECNFKERICLEAYKIYSIYSEKMLGDKFGVIDTMSIEGKMTSVNALLSILSKLIADIKVIYCHDIKLSPSISTDKKGELKNTISLFDAIHSYWIKHTRVDFSIEDKLFPYWTLHGNDKLLMRYCSTIGADILYESKLCIVDYKKDENNEFIRTSLHASESILTASYLLYKEILSLYGELKEISKDMTWDDSNNIAETVAFATHISQNKVLSVKGVVNYIFGRYYSDFEKLVNKLYQTQTDVLLYNTKDNLLMLADMVSTFVNVEPISGQLVIKDSLIKIEN